MSDWLGRDDDGDGIPNAIDADPTTAARPYGSSINEEDGPTIVPADAPPAANTAPADAPPADSSPSDAPRADARPPGPPAGSGATQPTPPTPPAPPPDVNDPAAMEAYQRQLQEYSRLMEMYSTVLKNLEDTQRSVIDNIR